MTAQLILNRYRLLETKGKGGFGTVDVAWDNRLQRRVAIKRIPLSDDKTSLPGIQEARTAALLNEPHIVSVLDFEVTGTEALLIMENVDGPTLSDLLEESTELLDLDTVAAIIHDVAAALDYAHENQVLHLDIKPDNILIDHKGNVKVTDFGLSELSGTVGFSEPQGGTIGYMPPEQIEQGDIDNRTDLWALGMLLYLMLAGMNPFHAKSSQESLELILHSPLTLPSAIHEDLDPAADEVIVTALLADKEQRYPSVHDFLDAVSPFLGTVQKGHKNLKLLVNNRDLDEVEFTDRWHQESSVTEEYGGDEERSKAMPWDYVPDRLKGFLGRSLAAAACACFVFLGLSGFEVPMSALAEEVRLPLTIGLIALIALGAFLAPPLGSALTCVLFVLGVLLRGHFFIGAALAVLLVIWWVFFGRRSAAESVLVMLTPLTGALLLSFALPLLNGTLLPWRRALITTVTQGLLLIAIAAMTSADSLAHTGLFLSSSETGYIAAAYDFIAQPTHWINLVAFLLAALVMTLFVEPRTRLKSLLGATVSLLIILLTCVLIPLFIDFNISATSLSESMVGLGLSYILLLLVLLLGVSADVRQTEEV